MIEYTDVNIEELHQQITQEDLIEEANERQRSYVRVPTGGYRLQAEKVEVFRGDSEKQAWRQTGRLYAHIQAVVSDKTTGQKLGTVFFDVSPEKGYRKDRDGNQILTKKDQRPILDRESQLWGQAAKAFELTNVKEILEAFERYPLDAFVEESFKLADGTYYRVRNKDEAGNPRTPEDMRQERQKLLEQVASGEVKSFNNVLNLAKVKA